MFARTFRTRQLPRNDASRPIISRQNFERQDFERQDYALPASARQDYASQDRARQDARWQEGARQADGQPDSGRHDPAWGDPATAQARSPYQPDPGYGVPPLDPGRAGDPLHHSQQSAPAYQPQAAPSYQAQAAPSYQAQAAAAVQGTSAGDQAYAPGMAGVDPRAVPLGAELQPQAEYAGEYAETNAYDDDYAAEGDGAHQDDGEWGVARRNTTKIVIAVLGLAVFGGAAFGYRTIFKAGPQGPPPVIHADNSPTKMVPTSGAADSSGKPINERLSGGTSERVVRREEDPLELRDPSRGGSSGTIVPGVPFGGVAPTPSAGPASPSSGPAALTGPKRVRTVVIRSDPAPAPERTAPGRAAARQTTPAVPAPSTGPLAITPQAMADATPPARAAAPPSPGAQVATRGGDGFVVQLSAQKSEAEAQSMLRSMQSRYSVLNGQRVLVRRKDQGDRGVFYAAQVGPFASKGEADQLCESLKSAGGNCFVQRN